MNLKKLRLECKLKQKDVAKILNVVPQTYCWYESERSEPTIETLCKLADYYNVSLDYLIGRKYKEADLNITNQRDKIKELINLLNISDLLKLEGYLNCLINNYK